MFGSLRLGLGLGQGGAGFGGAGTVTINDPATYNFANPGAVIYIDAGQASSVSTNQVDDLTGYERNFTEATNPPSYGVNTVFNYDALTFDGTNDILTANLVPQLSAVTLPDGAQNAAAGKGFTCTDIIYDADEDCFWVGNFGRQTPADTTIIPSIVKLSADLSTILDEFNVTNFTGTATSIQGVTIDTAANTLWFVSSTDDRIFQLNKTTGAEISYFDATAPNGLAYDPVLNELWVISANGNLYRYQKDGTLSLGPVVTNISDSDMLHLSGRELFVTYGGNGVTGRLLSYKIDTADLSKPSAFVGAQVTQSIEGFTVRGKVAYIANDAYYHSTGNLLNQIHTYPANGYGHVTEISCAWAGNVPSRTTGTDALFGVGTFASSGAGWGIFLNSSSSTSGSLVVNSQGGSGNRDILNFTLPTALTSDCVLHLDIDLVANTARLYQNNVEVSLSSNTLVFSADSTMPFTNNPFYLAHENGSRIMAMNVTKVFIKTGGLTTAERTALYNKMSEVYVPYTPMQEANLLYWYTGDDLTTTGTDVTTWPDQNSAADLTGVSGNEPQNTGTINGQTAVSFNGSGERFTSAIDLSTLDDGVTIYTLIVPTNTTTRNYVYDQSNGSIGLGLAIDGGTALSIAFMDGGVNRSFFSNSATIVNGATHIMVQKINPSTGLHSLDIIDTAGTESKAATAFAATTFADAASAPLVIGAEHDGTDTFQGAMRHMVVLAGTDHDETNILEYLSTEGGL